MRRKSRTDAKIDLEEEDRGKSVVYVSSSDDEEANEDLTLEIVEKARKRESKRSIEEGLRKSGKKSVRSDRVIDISSPSDEAEFNEEGVGKREWKRKRGEDLSGSDAVIDLSDGDEFAVQGEDVAVLDLKKKKIKKKMKSNKKKKEKVIEDEEKIVNNINVKESLVTVEAVDTDAVEMFDHDMKAEDGFLAVEDVNVEAIGLSDNFVTLDPSEPIEVIEPTIPEAIGTSDNTVLRKLLRGPRYFDPLDRHWDTCYNCGKEGHTIANCTEEKRKKPCFVCGKFGHGAKYCPQGQDCYICKRRGHIAKNCPEKHRESSESSKICLRCGDFGHDMSSCGIGYAPEDLKEIQCYICKSFGHLCCANIIDNGPREASCYNCGQSGHTGVGCAKARREASTAASPTYCYKCGEEGHFARGCNNSVKSGRWLGEPSTPRAHKNLGFRSVPHDGGKIHKKKTTPNGGRKFMTTGKTKQRGGWITDDPGDIPKRNGKVNGWMSPATSPRKGRTAAGRFSASQTPLRKLKVLFDSPSSPISPKPPRHRFSASRFGNNKGHFGRKYD